MSTVKDIAAKQRDALALKPSPIMAHAQMALAKTFGTRTETTDGGYTVVAYQFRGRTYVESITGAKE